MRKLKRFLVGALSVLTFGVIAVTSAKVVDATAYDYGTYRVTDSTSTNDTATWDFTSLGLSSNVYIGSGNSVYGIINTATNSNSRLTLKSSEDVLNVPKDQTSGSDPANMYIPVPAASAGTITIVGSSSNSNRYLTFYAAGVETTSTIPFTKGNGASLPFNASQITTYNNENYLLFKSLQTDGDYKIKSIVITLTTGEFAPTAVIHNVNIYDGNTLLKTYEVEGGDTFDASTFKMWGYNVELFTNSGLTSAYTTTTISADTDLYISKTADTTDYGYNLTSTMISTLSGVYNTSSEIVLTDYYTKGSAVSVASTRLGIKNTEAQSIKITVPYDNMKITVSCGNNGSSARNLYLYKTTFKSNEVTDFTTSFAASASTPVDVEGTLTAGTYYLSGENDLYIYSVTMVAPTSASASATLERQAGNNGTQMRYITTLTGVEATDVTSWNVTLTFDGGAAKTTESFTTLYLAVLNTTKNAANGTFYLVFTVTEIPTTANGKVMTAKMTVTFEDGSSITTNLVEDELEVTATE